MRWKGSQLFDDCMDSSCLSQYSDRLSRPDCAASPVEPGLQRARCAPLDIIAAISGRFVHPQQVASENLDNA